MRKFQAMLFAILLWPVAAAAQDAGVQPAPHWPTDRIATLHRWIEAAPHDALPVMDTARLDKAVAAGDSERMDREATQLALKLARLHLLLPQ